MPRKARQISLRECYQILGVDKGADLDAVKHAYRKRAFELHPDLNPGNTEASRQFQQLNEAYVALSAVLQSTENAREKETGKTAEQPGDKSASQERKQEDEKNAQERESEKASAAYAEQDVLRDLLNDPFARRVFEDIYSELNRKNEAPPETSQYREPETPKEKKVRRNEPAQKPKEIKAAPLWERGQGKGVKGAVKDWLRKQIDDEQTLRLPLARLAPGRKVRLQIRRGISDEIHEIEVVLPPDFTPGKPIRLRGLGKRVGPWQGDLYLTITSI